MHNSQDIAKRIKSAAKSKGLSVGVLLSRCGLGVNTVSKIANGNDILTLNFLRIAEELDVSVDYLLGRTENAESHKTKE